MTAADRTGETGETGGQTGDQTGIVDLIAEGERLLALARERGSECEVRAVLRQSGQQVVLLALPAGGGLPEHDAPGPASLLCLGGAVELSTAEDSWALAAGALHVIPPVRHQVRAEVDSVCVLTISLPR